MPAHKPAQTQILDAIHAHLLNITAENGYSATLRKIVRAGLKPFKSADMPSINYWPGGDVLLEELPGKQLRELEINIEFYDRHGEQPLTDRALELASDAHLALWRSINAPKVEDQPESRLGGIVDSFTFQSVQPAIGEGQSPFCGAVISLTVRYRVSADNPFQLVN